MKLYLVCYDCGVDNLDLFVRATSPDGAVALWRDYYALGDAFDIEPDSVVEVPPADGPVGAVPWVTVEQFFIGND